MSARRAPFPIKNSTRKRPYVKVTSKKYFVEVLLNLFPQQYYYYYYYYYYYCYCYYYYTSDDAGP